MEISFKITDQSVTASNGTSSVTKKLSADDIRKLGKISYSAATEMRRRKLNNLKIQAEEQLKKVAKYERM